MSQNNIVRLPILVVSILGITLFHYLTATQETHFHDIFRRLYYLPIILGGLWFSLRGGVITAIIVSTLYAPHVVFQWGAHPAVHLEQYLEILLYNVIGFLTGFLAQRETNQKIRYQAAVRRLEKSYAKLREQADLILEIEEQLSRASRLSALGELSAGLAHEIRNPLGSIRGTAEILQDGMNPADKKYEFFNILLKEVDRLNKVVQDFLQFAHRTPVQGDPLDVNEILEEVLTLVRSELQKMHVNVSMDGGANIPPLPGDQGQLKQAFLNLILNAIQAMPEGGLLSLTTTLVDDSIQVCCSDTGQGIPSENLNRIFNPFFTTRNEGTGLGLAITHRIIQGHGGNIEVANRVGEGTSFTITLPLPAE